MKLRFFQHSGLLPLCLSLLMIWFSIQPVFATTTTYTLPLSSQITGLESAEQEPALPRFCAEHCWSWSFLLPGLGQLFLGHYQRGFWFLAGFSLAPVIFTLGPLMLLETLQIPDFHGADLQPLRPFLALVAGLIMTGVYVWSLFDAHFLQFPPETGLTLHFHTTGLELSYRY